MKRFTSNDLISIHGKLAFIVPEPLNDRPVRGELVEINNELFTILDVERTEGFAGSISLFVKEF